jgi:uncharacterized protein (DUF1778 family)
MSKSGITKSQRLVVPVTRDQKQFIQSAAELEGRSITDFIVASAQSAAKQVIQDHEALRLSAKDREVFVQALLKPPKPAAKLRQAVRRYNEIFRQARRGR